ncbi:MAG: phosphatidylserine decarboxylase [Methanohalophilus sp. T328-1]|jgi:phosphatidylserine decarboxylase|uniref:phosphatidylserine decarboxylase n=1 Tax=Methanohalophilus sp. DAL1 TaxID=1864608 RepID=UPI00079B4BF3|nr:MAG: phosphatidylserine decarboxylase [Methanohalophilus sp. T328-1]
MLAKGSHSWVFTASLLTIAMGFMYVTSRLQIFNVQSMVDVPLLGGNTFFLSLFSGSQIFLYSTFGFGLLTIFFVFFFRDPKRDSTLCKSCILAPADGKISDIRGRKVCIFMNLNNVHVNRAPFCGKVLSVKHFKGRYLPAFTKDSSRNERTNILLQTSVGKIEVTQIAGFLARRIVTYVEEGDEILQGEKIGMIRLGSRVDVTIPEGFDICVSKGDRVYAGDTKIAKIPHHER